MKVMLLNPPIHHYAGFHYRMLPQLGLPIFAALLNRAGHTAEVTDLEALGVAPDRLQAAFAAQRDHWPDTIGITALTITVQGAKDTIAALRAAGYSGRIVVGGVHATLDPAEALSWGPDLVVTGECEGNVVELLTGEATGIVAGVPMPIEDIPVPDWSHHTPEPTAYLANMAILRPNPGISMWTRGCPWNCIMCGNPLFKGQATRYRQPASIEEEMRDLYKRGCRRIFVYDDELIGGPMPEGWMRDIADRIGALKFSWVTQGRCSRKHITPELLADVKRAGCRAVFWGIESFSPKVLRLMRKGTSVEDIWHTLRLAKAAGLENGLFTMIGNYGETWEDLMLTAEGLGAAYREGLVDYRQTTVVTAMPGTELQRLQEAEGWYVPAPNGGRQMMELFNPTPWLTIAQLQEGQRVIAEMCPPVIPT